MATALPPPCDESLGIRPGSPCINERGTLVATILGSSLAFVVGSVINVALPSMRETFGTDAAGAQWIVNAYLLPIGTLVLIGGALGDHYGRKRIFLAGLVVFTLATLLCALAPTLSFLLAARSIQGFGAALLAPNSLAILAASFREADRGRAVGTWASAGAIAGAVAPVVGGWLVDVASWRWAFSLVVPPAIAAWVVGRWAIRESRELGGDAAPLDWLGAALATGSLASLTWGLIDLPRRGLSAPMILFCLGLGTVLAAAFLAVERAKGRRAMMPLGLFATPSFLGISLLTLCLYAALGGLFILLPYTLMDAFGFSATGAGAAMLPFPAIMGLLSRRAGSVAGRIGVRPLLIGGPAVVAGGFALMTRLPTSDLSYAAHVLPALLLIALGMAASVAPLTTAVMNSVASDAVGVASGINNAIARSAGLLATALLGVVLASSGDAPRLLAGFTEAAAIGAGLAGLSSLVAMALVRTP